MNETQPLVELIANDGGATFFNTVGAISIGIVLFTCFLAGWYGHKYLGERE